jgi:hypothetical protein
MVLRLSFLPFPLALRCVCTSLLRREGGCNADNAEERGEEGSIWCNAVQRGCNVGATRLCNAVVAYEKSRCSTALQVRCRGVFGAIYATQ